MTTSLKYLTGFADAKLKEAESLDTICSSIIPGYSVERFEAVAFRLFLGKETSITVFALDKTKKSGFTEGDDKLPVKKFKLSMPVNEIIEQFSNINLTISTGKFDLKEMEVINK